MDKKELNLKRGSYTCLFLFSFLLILVSGCNTVKGAAQGAGQDWKSIKEADRQVQKVLW